MLVRLFFVFAFDDDGVVRGLNCDLFGGELLDVKDDLKRTVQFLLIEPSVFERVIYNPRWIWSNLVSRITVVIPLFKVAKSTKESQQSTLILYRYFLILAHLISFRGIRMC